MTSIKRMLVALACSSALLCASTVSAEKPSDRATQPRARVAPAASDTSACVAAGYEFGFFNGVWNTPADANVALNELRRRYGETAANGERIKYEVFYNDTNGFEDLVEVFNQRLNEQDQSLRNRFELFREAINGGGRYIDRISDVVLGFAGVMTAFGDYSRARAVDALVARRASPPTITNYAQHQTRIDASILEGRKMLLFAHSQGNLFANAAYDYAVARSSADSVRLIHVAPASPILHGPHTLADLDLVINVGLRATGTVPEFTTFIPGYLLRPPGLNGQRDFSGHGLLEIYLNPAVPTSSRIDSQVTSALAALRAPTTTTDVSGFFTATLTWNGTGDVDLHTFEPSGAHVYYAAAQGNAGFLDVDNTESNGPEHYFASCDPARLQAGAYRIGVSNYARAQGRTATVQISSNRDGVLTSRAVVLGADRGSSGDSSPTILVTVTVRRDPTTGQFSASVN